MIDPPPVASEPFPLERPLDRWWAHSASSIERIALIGLAIGGCFLFYLATQIDPDPRGFGTHEQLGLAPCSFQVHTGWPCLSCGMTTSFALMIRLRIIDAIVAQPAGVMLFLLLGAFVPLALWASIRGRSILLALDRLAVHWLAVPFTIVLLGSWGYTIYRSGLG